MFERGFVMNPFADVGRESRDSANSSGQRNTKGPSLCVPPVLVEARHLSRDFVSPGGKRVQAVSDVSLEIREGETLGLVGESGCGKSTLGRLLIRSLKPTSGEVRYRGQSLGEMTEKEFRAMRREMQMIFQDPYASLDPRMTVRDLIAEPLEALSRGEKREITRRVLEVMGACGLPEEFLYRYPHQFSGGQRQRIGIARAIAAGPRFIVCDEPVSALDISVQNQILNLLRELKSSGGRRSDEVSKPFGETGPSGGEQSLGKLTLLFISHDLSVVRYLSDRVCVMFLGKICETGPVEAVYGHPRHPYTRFLLEAVPEPDPRKRGREENLLRGDPPSPADPPSGCRFRTRCPFARERCAREEPPLERDGDTGAEFACFYPQ